MDPIMSRVFVSFAPEGEWYYNTISHRVFYIGQVTWRTLHPIPYTPIPPSEYSTRVSYGFPVPPGFVWQPPHPHLPIPADGIVPLLPHQMPPVPPPVHPDDVIEISDDEEEMEEDPAEDDLEEEPMEEDPEEEPMEDDPEEVQQVDEDEEEEIEIMDFEDDDEGSVVTDL